MRTAALFPLVTALLVLPAARAADAPAAGEVLVLTQSDSGRRLALPVGAIVRFELESNPSTGAEWQRRDPFGDVLRSVPCEGVRRRPLVVAGEPAPPVGSPVDVVYCFKAVAPGKAYLHLAYGRPWDTEAPAWKILALEIDVVPAP
ncbi:MAG: hypothetical protein ABS41_04320 [Arenimonas sp. SCN 70-307]|uniref:protease inhibitor I42 family protein n=1 Tax=Arenimonas sp. SCN 70-307 TaxID=1660089 RepID=UPI00086CDB0C|nr:protease inhibitor I42 family protein [Arenimonas sp. SCN 70-307]ODS63880.1 MAG: hypothetical protein ABS41_04320 [Arenimonas sp. SCN 70-307]